MLSTYVHKGAGGSRRFVVGYWCQFCDQWIGESEWRLYQSGEMDSAYSWSFSREEAYPWLELEDFKAKMREFRQGLIKELEERLETSGEKRRKLINEHLAKLRRLVKI
jgi:hypothetical protein